MKTIEVNIIVGVVFLVVVFFIGFLIGYFVPKVDNFESLMRTDAPGINNKDYSGLINFLKGQTDSDYIKYIEYMTSINNTDMNLEKLENYFYFYQLAKDNKLTSSIIRSKE